MATDNRTASSSSGGIGFVGLLTIVFIVLQLTHVINWSWWWVLSPLWISAGSAIGVLLVIGVVLAIIKITAKSRRRRRIAKFDARLEAYRNLRAGR